jgi:hypothetical protein
MKLEFKKNILKNNYLEYFLRKLKKENLEKFVLLDLFMNTFSKDL